MMPDNAQDPTSPLRVAYVNPAMTRITGFSAQELAGKLPAMLCFTRGFDAARTVGAGRAVPARNAMAPQGRQPVLGRHECGLGSC